MRRKSSRETAVEQKKCQVFTRSTMSCSNSKMSPPKSGKISSNNNSEIGKCSSLPIIASEQVSGGDILRNIKKFANWNIMRDTNERSSVLASKKGETNKRKRKQKCESDRTDDNNANQQSGRQTKNKIEVLALSEEQPQRFFSSAVESSLLVRHETLESSEVRGEDGESRLNKENNEAMLTDRVMPFDRFEKCYYESKSFCSRLAMIMLLELTILAGILLSEYPALAR